MKLLICTDGSAQAEKAVRFAGDIAVRLRAETTLLGITEKPGEEDAIFDSLRRAQQILKEPGVNAEVITKAGEPNVLLIAGGRDHTVPAAITTSTRKLYHKSPAITDFREFPDRGHSLTLDHGWQEVAQYALDWLGQRSL